MTSLAGRKAMKFVFSCLRAVRKTTRPSKESRLCQVIRQFDVYKIFFHAELLYLFRLAYVESRVRTNSIAVVESLRICIRPKNEHRTKAEIIHLPVREPCRPLPGRLPSKQSARVSRNSRRSECFGTPSLICHSDPERSRRGRNPLLSRIPR